MAHDFASLERKRIKRLRSDGKDKKIVSRMRNRKAASQALNGIRIDALASMMMIAERVEYLYKTSQVSKNWDEFGKLIYDNRDLSYTVRLLNLVDAMNQNQGRQREEFEKFVQAYLKDDKPAVKEIADSLAALREDTDDVLKNKKAMKFMEYLINDYKPQTEKDGGDGLAKS